MAANKEQAEQVGKAFITHYYTLFDNKDQRQNLASLYQDQSKMTYEGEFYEGAANIMNKLVNGLKFQTVAHDVFNVDCQPSGCNGVLVFVTGQLKVDGGANALHYSQMFHLIPNEGGGFWVHNDQFRLIYG